VLAVLTDRFPVASETFVVNEVDELLRLGHPVIVEANGRPPGRTDAPRHRVAYLDDDPLAPKPAALLALAARHPLAARRDLASQKRWAADEPVRRLRALGLRAARLRRAGVSHMHVHFAAAAALDAMRLSRILRLPFSVTAHAYEIFEKPANLREKLESAAFVTTGCEYNRRHLRSIVGPEAGERIHVIVMGVDPSAFQRVEPYPGGRRVIAVGRLVEKKGFGHLIDAVAALERERPVERLTIVGEGPLRESLAAQVDRLGLAHRVELAGALDPAGVRAALERADLLAMPAVVAANGDRDSMPVVVKEAMSMEIPIVASEEVGLPELVREQFGRLVAPGDADGLARAIGELLDLPAERRAEMGRAAREHAIEHCNLHRETARLAELIGL
jgi:glycosyltransferase involved in cell wall biosynthesis